MKTRCPYCDMEVSESAIEAEDGYCPECGSVISTRSSLMGDDDSDFDDELGDFDELEEEEDDFVDDELDDSFFDSEEFEEDFDDMEEEDF